MLRQGNLFGGNGDSSLEIGVTPIVGGVVGRLLFEGTGNFLQESTNLTYATNRLSPTYITLAAGTATAGTVPLRFTSGTLLTTAVTGGIEFLTDKYYGTITTGAVRKEFTLNDISLTATRVPFSTTNGRLTDITNFTFGSGILTVPNTFAVAGTGGDDGITIGNISYLRGRATTSVYMCRAGNSTGSGGGNVAIGLDAFPLVTTASNCVALGPSSLANITTGANNMGIGATSLFTNQTGSFNTAVGSQALQTNIAGQNTAIGYGAGKGLTTGSTNTIIGVNGFATTSTGEGNTSVGWMAGNVNTGNYNLFLGYSAGSAETGSNKLYIHNTSSATPLIKGDFSDRTLEIHGSIAKKIRSIAASTTIGISDSTLLVDASTGIVTVTLPTAASAFNTDTGRIYTIKKIDSSVNNVVVDGAGAELIDGAATFSITTQWSFISIQTNGTAWYIIAQM